jgi:hypothetical protein
MALPTGLMESAVRGSPVEAEQAKHVAPCYNARVWAQVSGYIQKPEM